MCMYCGGPSFSPRASDHDNSFIHPSGTDPHSPVCPRLLLVVILGKVQLNIRQLVLYHTATAVSQRLAVPIEHVGPDRCSALEAGPLGLYFRSASISLTLPRCTPSAVHRTAPSIWRFKVVHVSVKISFGYPLVSRWRERT